ncbi:NUMOD4 motif-containing HNH endonuclease [Corynebacterium variabile]|uniref:NUMOD4 motif-containing HNH endonuclease n=1 Tax=Corynebacterium variabile TaxID=1727 RepID=UPI003A5C88ED
MNPTRTDHEEWRPIPGYEGRYSASDRGRVRSEDRIIVTASGIQKRARGRILIQKAYDDAGHTNVSLGRERTKTVHSLVLEAFIGPRPAGAVTRHLNGVANDNRLENLTWGTQRENAFDTVKHGMNHMAERGTCPRGHALEIPNLVESKWKLGWRQCKSCHRAGAELRRNPSSGVPLSVLADFHFARIMKGEANGEKQDAS